jgi:hypothetical protein
MTNILYTGSEKDTEHILPKIELNRNINVIFFILGFRNVSECKCPAVRRVERHRSDLDVGRRRC